MKDYSKFLIKEFEHWDLFLNESQYFLGRTYLWAKRKDLIDMDHATPAEVGEYLSLRALIKNVLVKLFGPDKFNYYDAGNLISHLHVHIIPRYGKKVEFKGTIFEDKIFGKNHSFYDKNFKFSDEILFKIRDSIRRELK